MSNKKRCFLILMFCSAQFFLLADGDLPLDVKQFIEEYAAAKSHLTATTGEKIDKSILDKYCHFMFDFFSKNYNEEVYIYSGTFTFAKYKIVLQKYVDYLEYVRYPDGLREVATKIAREDYYEVWLAEKCVGVIRNGQIQYYPTPKEIQSVYDVYRTDTGLKVMNDSTFSACRIFESDIPLLLERVSAK